MANLMVKRNSETGITSQYGHIPGVGGRQEDCQALSGGGGYLNICKKNGALLNNDPRFDDLKSMGLAKTWLEVATLVGIDAFLQVWRLLDERQQITGDQRVRVPRFSTFLRYQRNRYIESLSQQGYNNKKIQAVVKRDLGVSVTIRCIDYTLGKNGDL